MLSEPLSGPLPVPRETSSTGVCVSLADTLACLPERHLGKCRAKPIWSLL